jgi:two-component system, NtrC family, nitrogen regulation sensor histidine kinase NtrY
MFRKLKLYQQIFIRLLVIMFCIGISFVLLQKGLIYSCIFMYLVLIILVFELFSFQKNAFLFYEKTILAILQNDFSADFSKHKSFQNYHTLFRLYEKLKGQQNDMVSKDIVYQSILNNVETGILILEKQQDNWNIFLMNNYFSSHFKVPKVSKWHYLKNQLPSLCNIIENQNFEEVKTSLQICIDQQDTQTFIMQASRSKTLNKDYYIVLLDSIQKVIEKKEKEAWINLMKVISHELLNSLTPIRSLSQNLFELTQQNALSSEDLDDIRQSVATMLNRSDHLQQFVESYRKLAMLPSPVKEKVALSQCIENGLQIMAPIFKQQEIEIINTIAFERWLFIDRKQMEQVVINLLTNSVFAVSEKLNKQIIIAAELKEKRIFISISDNGNGIDSAIKDKIFLPFFTTRKEGTGIGLTLSKNIIEAHGGYLAFQNDDEHTTFTICLIE